MHFVKRTLLCGECDLVDFIEKDKNLIQMFKPGSLMMYSTIYSIKSMKWISKNGIFYGIEAQRWIDFNFQSINWIHRFSKNRSRITENAPLGLLLLQAYRKFLSWIKILTRVKCIILVFYFWNRKKSIFVYFDRIITRL